MLSLNNVPLSVWNRALELYDEEPEATAAVAMEALLSAESRIDIYQHFPGITALAQAIAEHLSSDECDYEITAEESA